MRTRKLLSPTSQRRAKSSSIEVEGKGASRFVLQPVPPHARRCKKEETSVIDNDSTKTAKPTAASRFRERFSVAAAPNTAALDKCHALIREASPPPLPAPSRKQGSVENSSGTDEDLERLEEGDSSRDEWDGDTEVASSHDGEELKLLIKRKPVPMDEEPMPRAGEVEQASTTIEEHALPVRPDTNARLSADAGNVALSRRHRPSSTSSHRSTTSSTSYHSLAPSHHSNDSPLEEDVMILCMPPLTPYSPRRAAEAHTPRRLAPPSHLSVISSSPLSATLIQLGAARHTSLPRDIDLDSDTSPTSPITNTPLWAKRFQAQHQRRHEAHDAAAGNRTRLDAAEGMPRIYSRGDHPESPNGPLLRGEQTSTDAAEQDSDNWRPWKRPSELFDWPAPRPSLDSTPRGVARSNAGGSRYLSRLSRTLSSFLFSRADPESSFSKTSNPLPGVVPPVPPIPADLADTPAKRRVRGDGWGGLRAPSSWFKGYSLGPLASPLAAQPQPTMDRPPRKGLKSLYLPSSLSRTGVQAPRMSPAPPTARDAWVDCDDEESENSNSRDTPSTARSTSYSATPRDLTSPIPLKRLRVRFLSPLSPPALPNGSFSAADVPPPKGYLAYNSIPPLSAPRPRPDANDSSDSLLLRYRPGSIECTTLSHERHRSLSKLRRRGCFFLIILITLGTVVAVLASNVKFQSMA